VGVCAPVPAPAAARESKGVLIEGSARCDANGFPPLAGGAAGRSIV
jgi:hypothetical protein